MNINFNNNLVYSNNNINSISIYSKDYYNFKETDIHLIEKLIKKMKKQIKHTMLFDYFYLEKPPN